MKKAPRESGPGTSRSRRRLWLLVVFVVLAIVGLALPLRETMWIWIATEKVDYSGLRYEGDVVQGGGAVRGVEEHAFAGWKRVWRWGPNRGQAHGRAVAYYVENGRKALEIEHRDDEVWRRTSWNFDGTISMQRTRDPATSDLIGRPFPPAVPSSSRTSELHSGNLIVGEDRYLPPWWWGAQDQGSPRDGLIATRHLGLGIKLGETLWEDGRPLRRTMWKRDGTVRRQERYHYEGEELSRTETKDTPPWWDGVRDQIPLPASTQGDP